MRFPVIITAAGSDQTTVIHNEAELKAEILLFITENYSIDDIEIYEMGLKHKPALMFISTPFPRED